jgi:nucleotide-binding universal stress UspA family protein
MNAKTQSERFVVLAGVDGVLSDRVTLVAARFAAGIAGAELHLVHVIALPPATASALPDGRTRLEDSAAKSRRVHAGVVLGHLTAGDPCQEILEAAARLKADLVIVGTHARSGLDRLILGSVAEHVVRRASCPVLVVREKDYRSGFEPEIEAACPACLEGRVESAGERMWCVEHSQPHVHAHIHHATPESSFGLGSSLIRP